MSAASELRESYDLAVIGAGPAGLAAAARAAGLGVATVLFDEQPAPGGQIYRGVTETPLRERAVLGADYWHGADLVAPLRASGADYVAGAAVWSVSREGEIGVSIAGAARLIRARRVILATGALERPFPIPGWTLPGVMTAGAAQILLKSSGLVAQGAVVLAGTGPLLWLLAAQYRRAGARIAAMLDTTPPENRRAALPHLPAFLASPYFRKGLALLREVKGSLRIIRDVGAIAARGDGRLREVVYRSGDGAEERLPADTLLLHQGVAPNLNLANSIGCKQEWDATQLCFAPVVDEWGASSVDLVAIAGDGAGIAGAQAAEERGRLAALDAACRLGRIDKARRDREAAPHRTALRRAERGRAFLDLLYRPRRSHRIPAGDTIVCRCEEVTAQQITETVALGCTGPNQMKSFLRCGMGPCQGRLCGLTVTELIAAARGVSPAEVGYYRLRPPVKPITLEELAGLPQSDAALRAVVRS
ncbi:MAG TPA: NAD(P)/FAD-dependent oxidoreductase [Alphaproteobacteria bacterium]|nr:NAD(P)/FAD-dependent oxidoreductase [Alphaproteobacteria bacterium]